MATARPVLRYGNSCLRQRCADVEVDPYRLEEIFDTLWSSLDQKDGVGLAAPQIGIKLRAIVIRTTGNGFSSSRLEMANPVIRETFGGVAGFEEGCLSFPGLYVQVQRPKGIKVEFLDRRGEHQVLRDQGLMARIVQHELDHLDGRLLIDHLSLWRRLSIAPRLGVVRWSRFFKQEAGC